MAVGRKTLIGLALILLPACSTCRERRARTAPEVAGAAAVEDPEPASSLEPANLEPVERLEPLETLAQVARPGRHRCGGELRRTTHGLVVDLTVSLPAHEHGIVLFWAGDFAGRPARNHPATFDSREPVGFPWRPGTRLVVPEAVLGDGALDLYLLVIAEDEPGVYEVCEDRIAVTVGADAARVTFDLDPRPLHWSDVRARQELPLRLPPRP